jgi:hypothetical protein
MQKKFLTIYNFNYNGYNVYMESGEKPQNSEKILEKIRIITDQFSYGYGGDMACEYFFKEEGLRKRFEGNGGIQARTK